MFGIFKSKKPTLSKELSESVRLIMLQAFPGGDKQRELETSSLHTELQGKLTREETDSLLVWTKILLVTSNDLSLDRISGEIYRHEQSRLSISESEFVYGHITGVTETIFSGGNGFHRDDPVIINCSNTLVGKWAERTWLREKFGEEDKDWTFRMRYHGYRDNGSAFETFVITKPNNEEITVHFDISQWYLKNSN